jgi:hypothetical protein
MKCGWGCGAEIAGCNMRALHNMPEATGSLTSWTDQGETRRLSMGAEWDRECVPEALRRQTHGEPDASH